MFKRFRFSSAIRPAFRNHLPGSSFGKFPYYRHDTPAYAETFRPGLWISFQITLIQISIRFFPYTHLLLERRFLS